VSQPVAPGPLAGIRVLDLTTVLMGPYATQCLGDLGADVIKVESPEGDNLRHTSQTRSPGMGNLFLNCNRNKRSLVLDLKKPAGHAALLKLVERADVLVANVRPQAMARLKLAYSDLRILNPRLVYIGCFGYGQAGPYAARAAYDDLIQAMTAVPDIVDLAHHEGPRFVPVNFCDRVVGLNVVNATLAALFHRERSGHGQEVQVPMFETMAQFILGDHMGGATFVPQEGPMGYARIMNPHRRPFATQDGYLALLVYNNKQWAQFLDLIGRPEMMQWPRYATMAARSAENAEVYRFLAEQVAQRTTEAWMEVLASTDLPHAPVMQLDKLLDDPHLKAVGAFAEFDHPSEGRLRQAGIASSWSESPPSIRRHAPRLGEHSAEVLAEIGIDAAGFAAMQSAGVTK
jgi:crotonobetainyl-CoA:carnitine CoA-transferase CaiB-like acyl-CoA transferase